MLKRIADFLNRPNKRQPGLSRDSLISLSLLATIAGLLSAGVITLFRLMIEMPLSHWLPAGHAEGFESLSPGLRAVFILTSTAILILVFHRLKADHRALGVGHVLQRMELHQGYLMKRNLFAQFFGAVVALLGGHSVGREGPAVHLGAATASQFGQSLQVPHHRLRILAACGVASAISASFNTPMAGVIFAMEVVLLEYSIAGFIPIILASVTGAIVTRAVFGHEAAFIVPQFEIGSLIEIPYILVLAVVCGILGSAYTATVNGLQQWKQKPVWITWGILGIATAIVSVPLPEVMGVGYDSVNAWFSGEVVIGTAIALLIGKLLLSGWASAMGFPGGLIGPTLFIGASAGAIMGQLSAYLLPDYPTNVGFYSMLGMGAMMAAVLRAPLAALMALLELTGNPNIIMPGMLAIVIASLTVSEVFHLPSVFRVQTRLNLEANPVNRMLRNTWVAEIMDQSYALCERHLHPEAAELILQDGPEWIVINEEIKLILPAAELARLLAAHEDDDEELDLLLLPAPRQDSAAISLQANLQNALDQMQSADLEWLVVHRDEQMNKIVGLVSRQMIEQHYSYKPASA